MSGSVVPAQRCSAKANSTQQQCRRWALLGATVCYTHGGAAGQVRRAAAERVALQQAVADNAGRSPGEILMHAVTVADVLARRAVEATGEGPVTPKQLRALTDAIDRAGRLAASAMDSGLDQQWLRARATAEVAAQIDYVRRIAVALLGLYGIDPHPFSDGFTERFVAACEEVLSEDDSVQAARSRQRQEAMSAAKAAADARQREHVAAVAEVERLRAQLAEALEVVDRQRAAIARARTGLPELPPVPVRSAADLLGGGGVDGVVRWASEA